MIHNFSLANALSLSADSSLENSLTYINIEILLGQLMYLMVRFIFKQYGIIQ